MTPARYAPPRATYRLQMHAGFPFAEACRVVPYLAELGISHLYLSPIFAAQPGSEHGYDVIDHNQVNPELGGLAGLYQLGDELLARDMGLILDIVPNHVGIGGGNPWWRDVLRYGPRSHFANHFDIDWEAQPQMARNVLVVPVLGKPFGRALEDGELRLDLDRGEVVVRYYDHILPVAPRSYADLVRLPPPGLRHELRDPAAFAALVDLLDEFPRADPERSAALLERWQDLLAQEPAFERYVRSVLDDVNGEPGNSTSFDRLEALLLDQHYRLADWRIAGDELNYRRFFDVNGLAGIRVEREDVFDDVHRLLFELVERGIVTGVRVDHVDGLYDPEAYLRRLGERLNQAAAAHTHQPIPIYVEKILEGDEELPRAWPVAGATGYEFIATVDSLLVEPAGRPEMETSFRRFTGMRLRLENVSYAARLEVAEAAFAGEINVLAFQLHRIAQRHRLHRDNTLRQLRTAIRAVIASFPVYRTYLDGETAADRQVLLQAFRDARAREHRASHEAFSLLEEVLLLEGPLEADERERRAHFRRRFQQLSGPVMAKGFEDTTLYRYNRMISLNEVGGEPGRFGRSLDEAHERLAARARDWPGAMSASSTHDTKRSEDVRARLHVLSELPGEWRRAVQAWQRLNERHRSEVNGEGAPSVSTEYYLYQSLAGSWPATGPDGSYRERMRTHLIKAMREAKLETSWTRVNEPYEEAALAFLDAILTPRRSPAFLRSMSAFVERIRPAGAWNARAALALKVLAPGFPDIYQGSEGEALTLTDPDNRRPVHFDRLQRELSAMGPGLVSQSELVAPAGKLWLTKRLLAIRRSCAELCEGGSYAPLSLSGPAAGHVFAFVRAFGRERLVVAVPVRVAPLLRGAELPVSAWNRTTVHLPGAPRWTDLLSGVELSPREPAVPVETLFRLLPFAVLAGKSE